MNFTEAVTAVMDVVKRPDKLAEIKSAVNAMLAECTIKASFANDLVETTIPVDATLYGDTITFNNLVVPVVTRFRKFKYVKPTAVLRYLQPISANKIFTPSGIMQPDTYYVAGNSLTYTLKELTSALEVGYYQYAPILSDLDEHWMLDVMPWTIIDLASARVFKTIGDDNSFRTYLSTGTESYKMFRNDLEDSILAVAR